eukprot:1200683-Rhodomonas_salina.1
MSVPDMARTGAPSAICQYWTSLIPAQDTLYAGTGHGVNRRKGSTDLAGRHHVVGDGHLLVHLICL